MEGQIIAGKYRLERVLGKGGMGSVWLAEHVSLHTPVAVKIIHFEAAKNANARARFDREAQIAARIRSNHVVKVLDHGVTDAGLPYIAMECLTGECLRDRLQARGRLTPAETARVLSHICRALSRAHEEGLVHRDLKPENIFMAREDDEEIVKILDFGVAKATDVLANTGMDPTRTGALLGTPYYMSPEQAQGLKSVDFRSDLWSLGIVAFECLTGKRPFTAPALGPLIAKIMGTPPPSLSGAAPDARLPVELDAWVQKALSRDPSARFASAKELSEAFMVAAGTADTFDPSRMGPAQAESATAVPTPIESVGPTGTILTTVANEDVSLDSAATVLLPSTHGDHSVDQRSLSTPADAVAPPVPAPAPQPAVPAVVPAPPPPRSLLWVVIVLATALVVVGGVLVAVLLR